MVLLRRLALVLAALLSLAGGLIAVLWFLAQIRADQGYPPDRGRLVETAMGSIYVEEAGPADGEVVLLLHGSIGWSRLWSETAAALAAEGYRAIAFDMPPMGWSERPADAEYDRTTQGQRILALVDAMGIRPHLVAHSFGAGAGAEAALADPQAFASLVIVDGAIGLGTGPSDPPAWTDSRLLTELATTTVIMNPLLTGAGLRAFVHRKDSITDHWTGIVEGPFRRRNTPRRIAQWLPSLLTTPAGPSTDPGRWATLDLPVGILWGAEDTVTPLEQGERLAALIPRARLIVMPDIGHIPQIEDPAAFQAALLSVLR
ncbi:MAG: alpha/beta hydrolase [Jannaschia sp.]